MTISFRDIHPKRTCIKKFKNYRSFKPYLKKDFNSRCGYTDCPDFWFGGSRTFHIDHFKPKSKNSDLELVYSNLVYCCSYVNILKSNDEGSYIDPCDIDFNEHFERDSKGCIVPISSEANYMFIKLKLFMKRYQTIWVLEEIRNKMDQLKNIIEKEKNIEIRESLLITQGELGCFFIDYMQYLTLEQ